MTQSDDRALLERIRAHCREQRWFAGDDAPEYRVALYDADGRAHLDNDMTYATTSAARLGFLHAPVTEEVFQETERRLERTLPAILRTVYTTVANGGFGPGYGLVPNHAFVRSRVGWRQVRPSKGGENVVADDTTVRLERALLSLEGLSVGDALGQRFFSQRMRAAILIALRETPPRRWDYTDDTRMALSMLAVLHAHGTIDQDALALHFARLYAEDPHRGYGPAMHELLPALYFGESWRDAALALFDGNGSYGNGAAMRVAPLGAYFADDVERVAALAERSAVVTHAHPEAAAGAIAVAVAAAYAARSRVGTRPRGWRAFLDLVLLHVPQSEVRTRLQRARDLRSGLEIGKVVARLGNGSLVSAQDTVPFVLWCAAHHLYDFEGAVWKALSGMGDFDTNAAMVGGIVAPAVGWGGIPVAWREAREPLPDWLPRP